MLISIDIPNLKEIMYITVAGENIPSWAEVKMITLVLVWIIFMKFVPVINKHRTNIIKAL